MSLLVKCPFCPAQVTVSDSAKLTTCQKCFKTFDSRVREGDPPAKARKGKVKAQNESAPAGVNTWGAGGFVLAAFGLLWGPSVGILATFGVLSPVTASVR